MSNEMSVQVGGSAWDDGAAFLAALRTSDGGELASRRVLSFESWDALAAVLTKGRLDLLRHLHKSPAESIDHLAGALGQPHRRVHDDVAALESAGLIERGADRSLRVIVDAIHTEVRLDRRPAFAGV